jgi:hypothetical protein
MLDAASHLPIFRYFTAILRYRNGKNNMIWLALKSRQMRSGVEHHLDYFADIEGS